MSELLCAASAPAYARVLRDTVDRLADRLAHVRQPVDVPPLDELRRRVDAVDLDGAGRGPERALAELDDLFVRHAVFFHHPGYAAHLNCPVAVAAVAADALASAVNTSVDTYDQSAVATLMEQRLVRWVSNRIGFTDGGGTFTSGGTQSNLHGLLLARERLVRTGGLSRRDVLDRAVVVVTAETHFSIGRAAHLLGLGGGLAVVRGDAIGRMSPHGLARTLRSVRERGGLPMAVVATAGTTDRGVVDPIAVVAEVCDAERTWLHVDAAYGGGLLLSARWRHLLDGLDRARSVTVDFHKAFFQPVASSALLLRHTRDLQLAEHHADYLNPGDAQEPNQVDTSLQTTRRFDGLKLWATLRAVGADRLGTMVDRVMDLAAQAHELVDAHPDLQLVGRTQLSTVLFHYAPAGLPPGAADALVRPVRSALLAEGRVLVAATVVDARPCLKLTLLNPDLSLTDVRRLLDAVVRTAGGLASGGGIAELRAAPVAVGAR